MSLRFLKAKPKLNLSKDNKIRSVTSKASSDVNVTVGQETKPCRNADTVKITEKETQVLVESCENDHVASQGEAKSANNKDTGTTIPRNSADSISTNCPVVTNKEDNFVNESCTQAIIPSTSNYSINISGTSSNTSNQGTNKKFNFLKAKPKFILPKPKTLNPTVNSIKNCASSTTDVQENATSIPIDQGKILNPLIDTRVQTTNKYKTQSDKPVSQLEQKTIELRKNENVNIDETSNTLSYQNTKKSIAESSEQKLNDIKRAKHAVPKKVQFHEKTPIQKKILSLISENQKRLNDSSMKVPYKESPKNSKDALTKTSSTSPSKSLSSVDVSCAQNLILSKDNIDSIPIIIVDAPVNNHVNTELLDHMYAKQANMQDISKEEGNKSSKSKTFSSDQHSVLSGSHAFKSLLLLDQCWSEKSKSSSESMEFVDVIVCSDSYKEEETIINTVYPAVSECNTLSSLSLVTSIIKEEAGNPFQEDSILVTGTISDSHSNFNDVVEEAYADNIIVTQDLHEEDMSGCNIIPPVNTSQESIEDGQDTKAKKRKNVSFNLETEHTIFTNASQVKKPKTSHFTYLSQSSSGNTQVMDSKVSSYPKVSIKNELDARTSIEATIERVIESSQEYDDIDIDSNTEDLDELVKLNMKEYDPDYALDNECESDIDKDEREFVIYGQKKPGGKKSIAESVYLKRQHETLTKIKTDADWKESLTVNDLIFYNPTSNPMTNPPDVSVVNKNENILDMEKENTMSEDEEALDTPEPVPQLKIGPDGKLIIDPKSLIIQETGLAESKKRLEQSKALIESKYTIKKIDNLYTKRKFKPMCNEWAPEDTIMFYRALNTIGTDFGMMATLFENRNRADIKRKFKLEERKNPALLSKALRNFNNFDIEELKQELNEDKRRVERIREEEKERKRKVKEEKSNLRRLRRSQNARHNLNSSVCGRLTQHYTLVQYEPPHPKIFQMVATSQIKAYE